jgi:D-aminopeptidase
MNAFRKAGLTLGRFPSGPRAAITDVLGIRVAHCTLIDGEGPQAIRTGVTAIVPPGDPYAEPFSAGVFVLHGHGKALGLWQIQDVGELETPILLTNTLAVFACAEALLTWTLRKHPEARSINPVVLECNDGRLSAIELRPVREEHALSALEGAKEEVEEGCVGAGTGMIAFGYKSGIGTASRIVGNFILGALALPNMGRPEDFRPPRSEKPSPKAEKNSLAPSRGEGKGEGAEGSLIVVLATDAPLLPAQLSRLCRRAALGAARTGAPADTGSGDFFLAFSTTLRFPRGAEKVAAEIIPDRSRLMGELYRAAAEATEEAIYSALLSASPMEGRDGKTPPLFRA